MCEHIRTHKNACMHMYLYSTDNLTSGLSHTLYANTILITGVQEHVRDIYDIRVTFFVAHTVHVHCVIPCHIREPGKPDLDCCQLQCPSAIAASPAGLPSPLSARITHIKQKRDPLHTHIHTMCAHSDLSCNYTKSYMLHVYTCIHVQYQPKKVCVVRYGYGTVLVL